MGATNVTSMATNCWRTLTLAWWCRKIPLYKLIKYVIIYISGDKFIIMNLHFFNLCIKLFFFKLVMWSKSNCKSLICLVFFVCFRLHSCSTFLNDISTLNPAGSSDPLQSIVLFPLLRGKEKRQLHLTFRSSSVPFLFETNTVHMKCYLLCICICSSHQSLL